VIAVSLSAIRLFPMVVALLPLLRGRGTWVRELLLPTHFTSVKRVGGVAASAAGNAALSAHRVLQWPVGRRRFGFVGHYLAGELPRLLAGTLLFLTPHAVPDFDRAQRAGVSGPDRIDARTHAQSTAENTGTSAST
jgi:hypothetical protein